MGEHKSTTTTDGESSRTSPKLLAAGDRKLLKVELRRGETTYVSWKKLMKEASKSSCFGSSAPPDHPVPNNANPNLESHVNAAGPAKSSGDVVDVSRKQAKIARTDGGKTYVSWKKLMKEASKSCCFGSSAPDHSVPTNANPNLESHVNAPEQFTDVSTLTSPTRLRHILRRLLPGLRTRNVSIAALLFGFLAVVKARSSPGSSTDSSVNALLSIMADFGYNQLLAQSWRGNNPCEGWYGVQCPDGQIRGITLQFLNLTGSISERFADLTSLYTLDLSFNRLTGTIPFELTRMELLRSLDLSYNQLHGKVPHFKTLVPDTTGNPDIHVPSREGNHTLAWALSVGFGSLALASLLGVGIHFFGVWRRNRSDRASQPAQTVALLPLQQTITLESENKVFSLEVLREATEDFSVSVGKGASGSVYRGKLKDGREIAVKKIIVTAGSGFSDQFEAEVSVLSTVHHRNIVTLHGYCIQGDERLLVYEFMPLGELSKHLRKKDSSAVRLDWRSRLIVALDVARGLEYLHTLASQSQVYIHRDVKSANVLLGEDLRAKIADFGFVKITTEDKEPIHIPKNAGSRGYTAPEYLEGKMLSRKADVYSFGIILLELISGQKAYDWDEIGSDEYIARRFEKKKDEFWRGIEQDIEKDYETQESVEKVAELAGACCAKEAKKRPEMSQIVRDLSYLIETRDRRNQASSSGC